MALMKNRIIDNLKWILSRILNGEKIDPDDEVLGAIPDACMMICEGPEVVEDDYERKTLLYFLSREDTQTISLAYMYATGIKTFSTDVTKAWETALEQTTALEKARAIGGIEARKQLLQDLRGGNHDGNDS